MSARIRAGATAAALVLLAAQLFTAGSAAAAIPVPKGAYWYTIYDLQKAWKYSEGAGVTVAVVDTGVDTSLGDLRGQTVPGIDLTGADLGADKDDPKSANFGHGTDMAAKIAGSGKGGGMVGIAPKAKILPIDAGNSAGVENDLASQGIRDAVDRGAKVINLSFALNVPCDPVEEAAVKYAYQHDVIVVAGAGDSPGPVGSPANCPGALAIGGEDADGNAWTQTPSGPEIDFVGPAYNLVNEQLDGTLNGPNPGNTGTSSAAAFASGIFALLISKNPHESARQIVTRALYHVHNGLGTGRKSQRINNTLGYGELLPYYALTETTPTHAKNPIYDRFEKQIGAAKPGGSSTSASTNPGSSGSAVTSAPSNTASSSDSGGGFPSWALIVIIVVVVIGVISLVIALTRRGRHAGPPPGY